MHLETELKEEKEKVNMVKRAIKKNLIHCRGDVEKQEETIVLLVDLIDEREFDLSDLSEGALKNQLLIQLPELKDFSEQLDNVAYKVVANMSARKKILVGGRCNRHGSVKRWNSTGHIEQVDKVQRNSPVEQVDNVWWLLRTSV